MPSKWGILYLYAINTPQNVTHHWDSHRCWSTFFLAYTSFGVLSQWCVNWGNARGIIWKEQNLASTKSLHRNPPRGLSLESSWMLVVSSDFNLFLHGFKAVCLHPDPWVNDENDLTTSSCDDEFLKSLNRNPLKRWKCPEEIDVFTTANISWKASRLTFRKRYDKQFHQLNQSCRSCLLRNDEMCINLFWWWTLCRALLYPSNWILCWLY